MDILNLIVPLKAGETQVMDNVRNEELDEKRMHEAHVKTLHIG